ncbi:MAG: cyclase family protein [Chlorobiaceae bacterium]|nr:cyclase family protein [Chlorobiaceae bacterium]
MHIVDLSHAIKADMPVWPGTPQPEFAPLCSIGRDGFAEQSIRLSSHTGTHLDAPSHIIEGGDSLDRIDIGQFYGKGMLIDLRDAAGSIVPLEALKCFGPLISECDFILLHTGWSRFWGHEGYNSGYPVLAQEAASWISGFSIKGIGADAPSFDLSDSAHYPVHRQLLGAGVLLIENLTNFSSLPETGFFLSVLPLPVEGADASPVRAVALVPVSR